MDNMLPLFLNPHVDSGFGRDRPLYRMARSGVLSLVEVPHIIKTPQSN